MTPKPPPTEEVSSAGDGCRIDAELLAQMDAALLPEPLDAATQARIKQKLLRRIAHTTSVQHVTVMPGEDGWQPYGDGLRIKVLHQAGDVMSYLLRLAPGASLPAHRHPIDEECVVLEGEMQVGSLRIGAGGFHLGRQGLPHDILHSPTGALIYLRGAVPDLALLV
jgi:anti-sigma factor ChrR (cupin superfamily)